MGDTTTEVQITPEAAKQLAHGLVSELLPQNLPITVRNAVEAAKHDPEKALQMVAGEVIPFSQDDVQLVLLENLSSEERDPKTHQKKEPKSNKEKKRYQDSRDVADNIRGYLESPQKEPPKELLEMVYSYLASNPAFRELIIDASGNVKTTDAEAIAKTLLQQPQVRDKIRGLYVQRLDPAKRLPHEKEVSRLEQEVRRIMVELGEDIEQLIRDKTNEILRLRSQIQALPEYKQYQSLQRELASLEDEKKFLEGRLNSLIASRPARGLNQTLEDQIVQAQNQLGDVESKIFARKQNIANFLNDPQHTDLVEKMNNLTQLNQELQALEQKRKAIDPEQRRRLQEELAEKQAELQEARALLTSERIKYAGEIQSIVPEAVKSYLDEAFKRGEAVLRKETRKEAEKKETADKETLGRAVDKIVARIGRKVKRKGEMTTYVPDKKEAAKLLQKLLLPDGIDQLFNPTNGELKLDENHLKSSYGLTDEEAKVFIEEFQKDPTYRKQIASKMAQAVFADYIGQGGRLSKDVVMALTSTEWGKNLLDEGYNLLQERRAELEKVLGKGVISRIDELKGKTSEWFKGNWWKVGGGIALLILLFFLGKAAAGTLLPG